MIFRKKIKNFSQQDNLIELHNFYDLNFTNFIWCLIILWNFLLATKLDQNNFFGWINSIAGIICAFVLCAKICKASCVFINLKKK